METICLILQCFKNRPEKRKDQGSRGQIGIEPVIFKIFKNIDLQK